MYAIVRTGGKQYKVAPNTVVSVEKLDAPPGEECTLDDVLMVADDEGRVHIGKPRVPGASVKAVVLDQYRGKKIRGLTYKPKKNVRRRYGHRQYLTKLRVVAIAAGGE